MNKKKLPCSGIALSPEQGKQRNIFNVSSLLYKVKSKAAKSLYILKNVSRFWIQDKIQMLICKRLSKYQNKNYCKCHRVTYSEFVGIKRNPETNRGYFDNVITCSSWLCPVCGPRIMGYRSDEIRQAVHSWLGQGAENTCYMLTFTLRHSNKDSLSDLLYLFNKARERFWGHRTVKRLFSDSGKVGRITSNEIQYSRAHGWHPHQHVLIFCKKQDFQLEVFRNIWLAALSSVGLSGVGKVAFDMIEARNAEQYLTKLGSEMALGAIKEGRGAGHFSPFGLMQEAAQGSRWAEDRFLELFEATRGLHWCYWSKGLKDLFGIGEVSDEEIADNKAESSRLELVCYIEKKDFLRLSPLVRAGIVNAAAYNERSTLEALFAREGIRLYTPYDVNELQKVRFRHE